MKTMMAIALIICIAFRLPFVGRLGSFFLKKYMELSYASKLIIAMIIFKQSKIKDNE
ncbi:hypothetical protein L950_0207165 [Sphingobacterium sp. IITKGP-BTPF85]|nr:hypothetical protein L950_0207165 [Sphingobacterium sp. IITKGP-BTPF85]